MSFTVLVVTLISAALLATATMTPVNALTQDAPAETCDVNASVACPAPGDESVRYLISVTAVPDGVVILMTDEGIALGAACDGPERLAEMAEQLYLQIPAENRSSFELDWESETFIDEIFGHAWLSGIEADTGPRSELTKRANPINITFADYGGPGTMTPDAKLEQEIFQVLGATHRTD